KYRTNNRNGIMKNPIEPRNVRMSHTVGLNTPYDDGKKSSLKLLVMIMNRSNHMPISTTIETTNSTAWFRRSGRIHSTCGTIVLHVNKNQTIHAYLLKSVRRYQ